MKYLSAIGIVSSMTTDMYISYQVRVWAQSWKLLCQNQILAYRLSIKR